ELRFALITSEVRLHPVSARSSEALDTDLTGLSVQVKPSPNTKCVRCWQHRPDVGTHAEHPELCGRCAENVAGSGESRRYA
ncbi:MAG: hypothetical protein EOM22_15555, partial [Gammaproteobacteria bacterium]|nr:hypothetical protein [Gammaproteobacteria bacterium]